MEQTKITFSDLSGWLKAAIISAWIFLVIAGGSFIIGFFEGLAGV